MKQDELKTHDLYFAAYLQASGQELVRADRDHNGRVTFCFRGSEDLQELKLEWINRTGLVSAQDFTQSIRALKSLVHM